MAPKIVSLLDLGAPEPGGVITSGTLYRRIPPLASHWSVRRGRATDYAFKPARDHEHLSRHWGELTTAEKILADHPGFGLVRIEVAVLLELELRVTYQPEPAAPDHAAVWGLTGERANWLTKQMAKHAEPLRAPDIPG